MHSFSLRLSGIAHQVQCLPSCPDHTCPLSHQFLKPFLPLSLSPLLSGFSSSFLRYSFSFCCSSSLYLSCWHVSALALGPQAPSVLHLPPSLGHLIKSPSFRGKWLSGSPLQPWLLHRAPDSDIHLPLHLPTGCIRSISIVDVSQTDFCAFPFNPVTSRFLISVHRLTSPSLATQWHNSHAWTPLAPLFLIAHLIPQKVLLTIPQQNIRISPLCSISTTNFSPSHENLATEQLK